MAGNDAVENRLNKKMDKSSLLERFRGSYVAFSNYLGSGSFSDKVSNDPFYSMELLYYPRFRTSENTSVSLYGVLECELTTPGNATGRRCDPSDIRLAFHHKNLWTEPLLGGKFSGYVGAFLPVGYASRTNGTVMNLRASGAYRVRFFDDKLDVVAGFGVQKYIPTDRRRDTPQPSFSQSGIGISSTGGTFNDNWLMISNGHVGFAFTKKLTLSVDMLVYNYFRYSAPSDFVAANAVETGRSDFTWGIVELGYAWNDWLSTAFGTSSLQPALTADNSSVRFPFWDFISPSNNFSKFYLTANFTY